MFKTIIILYALNFWKIECTPNRGRSFPHWLASMHYHPKCIPYRESTSATLQYHCQGK